MCWQFPSLDVFSKFINGQFGCSAILVIMGCTQVLGSKQDYFKIPEPVSNWTECVSIHTVLGKPC